MAESRFTLSWADYAIFAVIIFISLGIGIFHALTGRRQRTTSEYFLGDRKMSYLPMSLSYTATFMSSIFFLGHPAELYFHGIQLLFMNAGIVLATFMTMGFTVPLFHDLRVTSAYEYLELRFNSMATRRLGSFFGILTNVIYMGMVLFGPAVALKAVTSFPTWTSVLATGLAAITYTAVGGIRAVVWTDVFQVVVMVTGLVAIFAKAMFEIGSFGRFWELNLNGRRFDISFNPDPRIARTVWTFFVGGTIKWFSFSFTENSVVRFVSVPSVRDARRLLLLSSPVVFLLGLIAQLAGLAAYAYYADKRCDPLEDGAISNSNQILPYFMLELFHTMPGLPGLLLAALFSASLSTLSSCLSSISACTLTDFIRPMFPRMSEVRATLVAKCIVVVSGSLAIGLSFLILQLSGTITQIAMSIMGAVDGPTCGMFLLGSLVPFSNKFGVLTGGVVGVGVTLWVSLGSSFSGSKSPLLPPAPTDGCATANVSGSFVERLNITMNSTGHAKDFSSTETKSFLEDVYALSFFYHAFLGVLVSLMVGVVVSLLTGPTKRGQVNPAHVSFVVRRFCSKPPRATDNGVELANNKKKGHFLEPDLIDGI